MAATKAYLIIDIGTGNVRVAITDQAATILHLERANVNYIKDELYPDALYFEPDELWKQVITMAQKALQQLPEIEIVAITASSQREGIVLIDENGKSLIGLPNHDHRGREWEDMVKQKDKVYQLTGRYPTSLFSAVKLMGVKNRRPAVYERFSTMLSISDWVQFKLSGIKSYEHSQASETVLYDVEKMKWSQDLCSIFNIDKEVLAELKSSGTILGNILPEYADLLHLSKETVIIVGGADTQLAIKSTRPRVNDIVIVSGTTTPIVKIVNEFIIDDKQRSWTNRHVEENRFILEVNAGVTGLNYQRLKQIFYPNESYAVIEKELSETNISGCVASLGSLVAEEKSPLTKGGFIFNTPVSHELGRASFVRATLWDIACCIKENLECLCSISGDVPDFVWACGGGFQSKMLRQFVVNLTGKRILIREGYQQSSVAGAALVCNETLGIKTEQGGSIEETFPKQEPADIELYNEWKDVRKGFSKR
ncbi:MAG: FGGY family carbohydrate kinase [Chitinophagaceae bacterium]